MKIHEYSKTHAFIYSQTYTGTYTYTTAQAHLKNTCARITCIHAHFLTNAQLHIRAQLCSCTHSLTHSLTHSVIHSLTYTLTHSPTHSLIHSLTYFHSLYSHSLFLSPVGSYKHIHTCSYTNTNIHGLTRSCALIILFSLTYSQTRTCT